MRVDDILREQAVFRVKPQMKHMFLQLALIYTITAAVILLPCVYFLVTDKVPVFFFFLAAVVLTGIILFVAVPIQIFRMEFVITRDNLYINRGGMDGGIAIVSLRVLEIVNEDKIRAKNPKVCGITVKMPRFRFHPKDEIDSYLITATRKAYMWAVEDPVAVCDLLHDRQKSRPL